MKHNSLTSKEIETLNDKKTYFCINCKKPQLYMLTTENVTLTVGYITFTYKELQPLCITCGEPIYVPEINDINIDRKVAAYIKEVDKPFTTNSNTDNANTVFPNQEIYASSINN